MSNDLVKRARYNALADMPHYASVELIEALADRIEELEAENENLKANLTHLRKTCQRAWDKCDEERVKLAKAVDELQEIASLGRCDFAKIRTTLAELKGEKDE